jgi:hypothetical protein
MAREPDRQVRASEARWHHNAVSQGWPTEVSEQDWVDHFDAHVEVYAALYAVVFRGWELRATERVMHADAPFHRPAPVVQDWVWTPAQRARRKAS